MQASLHSISSIQAGVIHRLTKSGSWTRQIQIKTRDGQEFKLNVFSDQRDDLKVDNKGSEYLL